MFYSPTLVIVVRASLPRPRKCTPLHLPLHPPPAMRHLDLIKSFSNSLLSPSSSHTPVVIHYRLGLKHVVFGMNKPFNTTALLRLPGSSLA